MKNFIKTSMSSGAFALALVLGGCGALDGQSVSQRIFDPVLEDNSDLSVRVKRALRDTPRTSVNNIQVSKVGDDTVKLSGFVFNDADSDAAERVAGRVEGVRHVFNALIIQDD